ncbi:MAG TPA: hypothetical protein VG779_00490 [Actinomycetota bacterium]|jgi:hypothetical protein|nr:hypothetical protein [Actinomycetota bacterium]
MTLYEHIPHPHIANHRLRGPVKVADQLPQGTAVQRLNARFAVRITKMVGSMWCAYLFAAFDLLSLPAAIKGGISTIVAWVAQTFLQLVLLSIIMVGQNVQSAAADKRSEDTYLDAEAVLHEAQQIQAHLAAQDAAIEAIAAKAGVALVTHEP